MNKNEIKGYIGKNVAFSIGSENDYLQTGKIINVIENAVQISITTKDYLTLSENIINNNWVNINKLNIHAVIPSSPLQEESKPQETLING